MSETDAKRIIEAVLFVADEPLSAGKLAEAVGGVGVQEVRAAVDALRAEYEAQGRAFTIEELAGGYRMLTRPEYHPYLSVFSKEPREVKLSPAALETLAIVAYKQPINRAEVEAIRGVDSSGVMQRLLEYRLVRIVGRSEELGRPLLYGTTKEFLEHFGLKSIRDLPEAQELLRPEAAADAGTPPPSAEVASPGGVAEPVAEAEASGSVAAAAAASAEPVEHAASVQPVEAANSVTPVPSPSVGPADGSEGDRAVEPVELAEGAEPAGVADAPEEAGVAESVTPPLASSVVQAEPADPSTTAPALPTGGEPPVGAPQPDADGEPVDGGGSGPTAEAPASARSPETPPSS